jgi:CheY-like chemotaxis protein
MALAKSILVVDDDIDIRDTLAQVLEDEGYAIARAGNGEEALAYLRATDELPSLILLDLMMPVMNGAEFHEAQMSVEKFKSIPVVVITASGSAGVRASGITPADVIQKPIPLEVLLETVRRCIA